MVLPLIPIAIAGLGGAGGFGLASWLGRGKKQMAEIHAPQEYYAPTITTIEAEPYQYYAPQVQFAPVTTYGYVGPTTIIDSPGARVKKEQIIDVISQPTQRGAWEFPIDVTQAPEHRPGDIAGVNMTHIAIIAAVGVIGYSLLKKKKK